MIDSAPKHFLFSKIKYLASLYIIFIDYLKMGHSENKLDLGKHLVFQFVSEFMPEKTERVEEIFSKKGAYSRFKDLLEHIGLLDKWYEYENKAQSEALKEWCSANNIEING